MEQHGSAPCADSALCVDHSSIMKYSTGGNGNVEKSSDDTVVRRADTVAPNAVKTGIDRRNTKRRKRVVGPDLVGRGDEHDARAGNKAEQVGVVGESGAGHRGASGDGEHFCIGPLSTASTFLTGLSKIGVIDAVPDHVGGVTPLRRPDFRLKDLGEGPDVVLPCAPVKLRFIDFRRYWETEAG